MADKLILTDAEWRARLSPEAYEVLRGHGTERAFSGCFVGTHDAGTYVCAGCGNSLFPSGRKFESGTGWPSFTEHEFGVLEACDGVTSLEVPRADPNVPLNARAPALF